jgi:hypothetical protein
LGKKAVFTPDSSRHFQAGEFIAALFLKIVGEPQESPSVQIPGNIHAVLFCISPRNVCIFQSRGGENGGTRNRPASHAARFLPHAAFLHENAPP